MSVRLVRKTSDTPNITNRDDTRMTRYAYGGVDGVMQCYGNELSYSIAGPIFTLNSGCIVLQGWEVDVEGSGWQLDLSTVVGTQYHLVYLEVNVAAQTAVIKSAYLTGTVPTIDLGDDLFDYPDGTARLPLYSFVINNGVISSVSRKFSLLYFYENRFKNLEANYNSKFADVESRLNKLGFKQGDFEWGHPVSESTTLLKRQGNYVIGTVSCTFVSEITDGEYTSEDGVVMPFTYRLGKLPANMKPKTTFMTWAVFNNQLSGREIFVDTSGWCYLLNVAAIMSVSRVYIPFGYEAKPL